MSEDYQGMSRRGFLAAAFGALAASCTPPESPKYVFLECLLDSPQAFENKHIAVAGYPEFMHGQVENNRHIPGERIGSNSNSIRLSGDYRLHTKDDPESPYVNVDSSQMNRGILPMPKDLDKRVMLNNRFEVTGFLHKKEDGYVLSITDAVVETKK